MVAVFNYKYNLLTKLKPLHGLDYFNDGGMLKGIRTTDLALRFSRKVGGYSSEYVESFNLVGDKVLNFKLSRKCLDGVFYSRVKYDPVMFTVPHKNLYTPKFVRVAIRRGRKYSKSNLKSSLYRLRGKFFRFSRQHRRLGVRFKRLRAYAKIAGKGCNKGKEVQLRKHYFVTNKFLNSLDKVACKMVVPGVNLDHFSGERAKFGVALVKTSLAEKLNKILTGRGGSNRCFKVRNSKGLKRFHRDVVLKQRSFRGFLTNNSKNKVKLNQGYSFYIEKNKNFRQELSQIIPYHVRKKKKKYLYLFLIGNLSF